MKTFYELKPIDGRKSFGGKAVVTFADNGNIKTLYSYGTKILEWNVKTNKFKRFYDGWTQTTGRHIKAFCGMSKEQFKALKVEG